MKPNRNLSIIDNIIIVVLSIILLLIALPFIWTMLLFGANRPFALFIDYLNDILKKGNEI